MLYGEKSREGARVGRHTEAEPVTSSSSSSCLCTRLCNPSPNGKSCRDQYRATSSTDWSESTGSPYSATCSSSSTFRSHRFPLASRAVSFDCSAGHRAGRRREHREARQHRQPGLDRLDDRAPPAGGPTIRPVAYCARARHDCSRARTAHRLSFARQRRLEGLRSRQGPVHLLARGNLAGKGTRHRLEEIT